MICTSDKHRAELAEEILNSAVPIQVDVKKLATYTDKQRASLHLWCEWVAEALNDAGYDIQTVLAEGFPLPWDKDSVKSNLYKPVLKAMKHKTSTEEQMRVEPGDVHKHLEQFLAEKFGISVPWPCIENMREE